MDDETSRLERRIGEVERRLAAMEARWEDRPAPPPQAATPPVVSGPRLGASSPRMGGGPSAAIVLGWAGTGALVLAAAYLVRLGIEYGWLTPSRQVLAAAVFGSAMIAAGLVLRIGDRPYASLLGAGGVAVLYLSVFGSHLYHHLIGASSATGLAIAVAAGSLALHAVFRARIYVAFSLAGSYATPLLVQGQGSIFDLILYLAIWDLVYCAYAVWMRSRMIAIAALYGSLSAFFIAWTGVGMPAWEVGAIFQLFQFVLFVSVAVLVSVRAGRPMDFTFAILHAPALVLFYGLEHAILDRHAPALAPWAAIGFALALYAAWLSARRRLAEPPRASLVVIHGFAALVLVHGVYVEAVSRTWRPLTALVVAVSIVAAARARPGFARHAWPLTAAAALLFLAGSAELYVDWARHDRHVGDVALVLTYPVFLYALYFDRSVHADFALRTVFLAVAHLLLLASCALLIERWSDAPASTASRLWLSLSWAAIGVVALAVAVQRGDRLLARSALGIFFVFAFKVLRIDLAEAPPLAKVGSLVVLGLSLYAGGWIYRRLLPRGGPAGDAEWRVRERAQ